MHWTEHPPYSREHLAECGRQKPFVFAGLNYLDIFLLLTKDRYQELADHSVEVGGHCTNDEVTAFLRNWTATIPFVSATVVAAA